MTNFEAQPGPDDGHQRPIERLQAFLLESLVCIKDGILLSHGMMQETANDAVERLKTPRPRRQPRVTFNEDHPHWVDFARHL